VFFSNYHTSIVKVRMDTASLSSSAQDMESSKAWAAITAKKAALQSLLPKEDKDGSLFAWLISQESSVVLDLLAFCTALSVDAIQGNDAPCVSFTELAKAVELNMCDWWEPTQASYFQHVPKLRIVEVVTAAVSSEIAMPLALMKKGAAAEAAERAVMDTRWLPQLLKVA
jgi:ParB family chromosome partitioning protein